MGSIRTTLGASAHVDAVIHPTREVVRFAERDGIEVGVFADDSTFMSVRAAARLAGLAVSSVQKALGTATANAKDLSVIAASTPTTWDELLLAHGHAAGEPLYDIVLVNGGIVHALREATFMALLEWYAVHSRHRTKEAAIAFAMFARAGARLYIHGLTGHTPTPQGRTRAQQAAEFLRERIERVPPAPTGYWFTFVETSDVWLRMIDNGAPFDPHSVPDISIGQAWAKYYRATLAHIFGTPKKAKFRYPASYPQGRNGWVSTLVYPDIALGAFKVWLRDVYFHGAYQKYIARKLKQKMLAPGAAQHLLAAVSVAYPARLTA